MRTTLIYLIFTGLSISALAQVKVHTDMRTPTWNTIGLRYDAKDASGNWASLFPPALRKLNNTIIELPGYMIPTKVGSRFTSFLFSIVPIASCPYCGSGDIPAMIEVKTILPVPITEKPIKLKGLFIINEKGDDSSEFMLLNAKVI